MRLFLDSSDSLYTQKVWNVIPLDVSNVTPLPSFTDDTPALDVKHELLNSLTHLEYTYRDYIGKTNNYFTRVSFQKSIVEQTLIGSLKIAFYTPNLKDMQVAEKSQ